MKRACLADAIALASDLADLSHQSMPELRSRWLELYGHPAPARINQSLLIQAVAYRLQEDILGGLKPGLKKKLLEYVQLEPQCAVKSTVGDASDGPLATLSARPAIRPSPKPGTVLLREWQGVSYTVQVIEEGVVFQGKAYRSLSEVARRITGQRWSGPRFFGLRSHRNASSRQVSHVT